MYIKALLQIIVIALASFVTLFAREINTDEYFLNPSNSLDKISGTELRQFNIPVNKLKSNIIFDNDIIITGLEVENKSYNLVLDRKRSVIDGNSSIITQSKTGEIQLSAPEIISFSGRIQGEPETYASLVIINNQLYLGFSINNNYYSIKPEQYPTTKSSSNYILSRSRFDEFTCYNGETPDVYENIKKPVNFIQSDELLECELALETDTEFFKANGSNLNKSMEYALLLVQMLSNLYEKEVNVIFYVSWLKCWTDSPVDPYGVKGDAIALPDKAIPYWKEHYKDVKRDLAHVMTSISYGGGGYGYYNALCGGAGESSISCSSVQSGHNYPTTDFTYDVYILAHEIGHNFNARHTHSCFWDPPIDTCVVEEGIGGGCLDQGQKPLPNPGTIMSYCGAINNATYGRYEVQMTFDPQNRALIRKTAEEASCLGAPSHSTLILTGTTCSEVFFTGDSLTLNWVSQRVQDVRISYSSDNGSSWETVEESHAAANLPYRFAIPDLCNEEIILKVTNSADDSVYSVSDALTIGRADEDGMIACYPFNGDYKDIQQCGLPDLLPDGTVPTVTDRFGSTDRAVSFNNNAYLKADRFVSHPGQFTVSLWFNTTDISTIGYMLCQDWEQGTYLAIWLWNGNLGGVLKNAAGYIQPWAGMVETNKWYHCALTYDGNNCKIYLNGELKGTNENTGSLLSACSPLYIGSRNGKESFNGMLDDVIIYNKALSSSAIVALYNTPNSIENTTGSSPLSLSLSPVPVTGTLTAGFNEKTGAEGVFSIYMPDGRQLLSNVFNSGEQLYTVDVAALNSGIYFYTYTAGTDVLTGQFVICR